MKKYEFAFFDQKHGLTPLQKCDFGDCQKLFFLIMKTKIFKVLRNRIFPKGLTHAFVKKIANFFVISFRLIKD